jgi:uncharacterized protein YqjF (DUF2071 family)
MRLPIIHGLICRRLLVNFRVDAEVMRRFLPAPFRPKLHNGYAVAGICLIRLEQIRPRWLPSFLGIASENAAHRIAVQWDDPAGVEKEGVFIPRRDTGSFLNHLVGGRLFPGEHRLADFDVTDNGSKITMAIRARDGLMALDLRAQQSDSLPNTSCFASLQESSAFFAGGSVGYSVTHDSVDPLPVEQVHSTFFSDASLFPTGSVAFDHALIMRDIGHEWHEVTEMFAERTPNVRPAAKLQ